MRLVKHFGKNNLQIGVRRKIFEEPRKLFAVERKKDLPVRQLQEMDTVDLERKKVFAKRKIVDWATEVEAQVEVVKFSEILR